MVPVERDAETLAHARTELATVEGESSFNGDTPAEEDRNSSFAKESEEVEVLIDPPGDQYVGAWKENEESGFVPSDFFSLTAIVKTMESILPSEGSPQEATRSELCGTTEAEGGDTPFSKSNSLVQLNCEASSGEAPETAELVPSNLVPPKLSAATSLLPGVIQETITRVRDPAADAQEVLTQSEKAEVHLTADPPGETQITSMQRPAIPARQINEGAERNRATSLRSKIRVSFPTKPGALRAKKVSLALPP